MYDPIISGQRHTFGVSGLLYHRNLLLYDRQTESLWSQLMGKAVTGPLTGTPLRLLPAVNTSWEKWKQEHPQTLVLSFNTGYRRDYAHDPYQNFPLDRRQALVVIAGDQAKIYPFSELKDAEMPLTDRLAGSRITVEFDRKEKTARVREVGGSVRFFVSFLADARAFYPEAPVFKAD